MRFGIDKRIRFRIWENGEMPSSDILAVSCLFLGVGLTFLLSPRWGWFFLALGIMGICFYLAREIKPTPKLMLWLEGGTTSVLLVLWALLITKFRARILAASGGVGTPNIIQGPPPSPAPRSAVLDQMTVQARSVYLTLRYGERHALKVIYSQPGLRALEIRQRLEIIQFGPLDAILDAVLKTNLVHVSPNGDVNPASNPVVAAEIERLLKEVN